MLKCWLQPSRPVVANTCPYVGASNRYFRELTCTSCTLSIESLQLLLCFRRLSCTSCTAKSKSAYVDFALVLFCTCWRGHSSRISTLYVFRLSYPRVCCTNSTGRSRQTPSTVSELPLPQANFWAEKTVISFLPVCMVLFSQWPFLHYNKANDVAYCHACLLAFKQRKMSKNNVNPAFVSEL